MSLEAILKEADQGEEGLLKEHIIELVRKWLESYRPKSVESMDEIIANDFIDYLVNSVLQTNANLSMQKEEDNEPGT